MKKLLITIPCYNEELVLEKTVFTILEYAQIHLVHYDWKILILDNNSSDDTWKIASNLKTKHPEIILVDEVRESGRGVALRISWERIKGYDIYTYMDADLATDLKDFLFIVTKVDEGYDFVTGSRYLAHSDARRSFKRKLLSRIYNILIQLVLGVSFKDAQCGFKAFSKKIVEELIPATTDNSWFWDTELMIYACRKGYRVLEVPVTWREVRDELRSSKVSVWSEVIRNLKNIYRMRKKLYNSKQ
ncbi:MAG: glycosyltransferase [Candidatus Taylorbacteria bacterium]|nr:glycosyltransferase [Candidatus Taylorbacteria bacterium]